MSFVLCRIPNHVGDCCMALPGLRLLEASGFTPVLTGKRWAEDLLAGTGWRFEPIEGHVSEDLSRIRNIAKFFGGHPQGLLFPNSFNSALLYWVGSIRSTGFPTDFRRMLLAQSVPEPGKMHEVERFFTLAHEAIEAWGKTPAWDKVPPQLGLTPLKRHEAGARNLMESNNIPQKFALLAPVARGLHHGKKKHWEHFNALCAPLRQMGIEPVVFPAVREVDQVKAACPDARICPPTTLGTLAALAKRASVVIANDSGLSHVAAAVGATQITLIGVTDPTRTSPWNPHAMVLGSLEKGWPTLDEVLAAVEKSVRG
ncbi:glycosyltransferase family 9 protein [Sutterella sp.]|uniref:glycosyltransferase family 9 protein n=1 Tax=Sutterella sp. TaxID=1981025 RepID=UPI0026E0AE40|nr:glycosyltransferase family 9 protein [Sutterella sp.]MDO5532643.1 glycosyltransferase family 9 protein [Sutterella sp.]